jgi:hypothetical protein
VRVQGLSELADGGRKETTEQMCWVRLSFTALGMIFTLIIGTGQGNGICDYGINGMIVKHFLYILTLSQKKQKKKKP